MRWTAHISILFALAMASAFATAASSAPRRQQAPAQASQGRKAAAPTRSAEGKAPAGSSRGFAEAYQKGYAAGRAAARKEAATHGVTPQSYSGDDADAPYSSELDPATHPLSGPRKSADPRENSASATKTNYKIGPMPAPLRGSYSSLQRQNKRLEQEGLERIEDQRDLDGRINNHLLVPVPTSTGLVVNQKLPENRRYCRPWTARFLSELAAAHDAAFHEPLEVNSAVRTVAYQKRLRRANSNAAPAKGNVVSPHLTGAAVDIAKEQLTRQELAWMRRYLLPLQKAGKIDVEEEFQQACFHITVYKGYESGKQRSKPAAPARKASQQASERTVAMRHQPAPELERERQTQPTPRPSPSTPKAPRKSAPANEPTEVIVAAE